MSAGYTPAPWGLGIASHDPVSGFWQCLVTKNGVAFITIHGATKEECEANARLVLAGPEMLSALKKAKKHAVFGYSQVENQVDDAIAKAEAA